MGQKVNPYGLRVGIVSSWKSRWYSKKEYVKQLKEDVTIRESVFGKLKNAAVGDVEIERSAGTVKILIKTARPGVIIGRGGTGLEDIKRFIKDKFFRNRKIEIKIEVEEIKNIEESARVIAQNVAEQLEKRIPYRRAMKGVIDQVMESRRIKGVKIEVAGRLGGTDIARREWLTRGILPLHTLRADIDFAKIEARTTYGAIGVKVWVCRGEKFE
jgi:small subunit ribosomal protein S3